MSDLKIEPFDAQAHTPGLIQALLRLRASGSAYPPAQDADNTAAALGSWLMDDSSTERWVITHLGAPVGHVLFGPAHKYLVDHIASSDHASAKGCQVAEVGKFFMDPECAGQGAGSLLFQFVLKRCWDQDMQPALAVLPGSEAAMRLYRRFGMEDAGAFEGVHGTNFVFVDPRPRYARTTGRSSQCVV